MQNDMFRLFDLDGRVALVSGGSSGIGKTIGLALARAGASVVLVARRAQELASAASEFEAAGLRARPLPCDLADREALRGLAARAAEPFGAPDILVNASGINVRKPFEDTADEDWDRSLAINLTAPFLLTRALAPAMRERGWGRIINITSLQCVRAFPDSAPYGASKGGLMQLTRAIAEYWSRYGVTCNAIAPGFFETPLTAPVMGDPDRVRALAASTMIGRNGQLDDLHGAAVFLASEASAYITGQTLFIDGGFSAR
ncbi:gluconate 5-dehydrogenase [Achromobacter sp. RTa]|uniref:SDR family NAD(P)-dependent oxidoreductase n=1 Tax=Achromobacter sp. RTa TaxID=1532557 RepID=UPI00050F228E|nr:SDR family oxidoreductase [Achromobacter sp. RTa]KGD95975.1 gluconate 5-dehydrogenase [Achromobacter sp. RTa]